MIAVATFLQIVALAAIAALLCSLALSVAQRRVAPERLGPEGAFTVALLPLAGFAAVFVGVVTPPALSAIGWTADHCTVHDHHGHFCFRHGEWRPVLSAVGAVALAGLTIRLLRLVRTLAAAKAAMSALSRENTGTVVNVESSNALLYASVWSGGRILVSRGVRGALTPEELAAALAHERQHLLRRDPFWYLVAHGASVVAVDGALAQRFEQASEVACDAEAVRAGVDPVVLASALLKLSRVSHLAPPGAGAAALIAHPIERRIRALLAGPKQTGSSARAVAIGLGVLLFAPVAAVALAPGIHHLAETLVSLAH